MCIRERPSTLDLDQPFVPDYNASANQPLIRTSTGIWTTVYNEANRAVDVYKRQEEWLAGAPDVYARGRTRMTRDLTGVQT